MWFVNEPNQDGRETGDNPLQGIASREGTIYDLAYLDEAITLMDNVLIDCLKPRCENNVTGVGLKF